MPGQVQHISTGDFMDSGVNERLHTGIAEILRVVRMTVIEFEGGKSRRRIAKARHHTQGGRGLLTQSVALGVGWEEPVDINAYVHLARFLCGAKRSRQHCAEHEKLL